jgi:hypothetical protein
MDEKLLKPSSYQEMETEVRLKNGVCSGYGLGVDVSEENGHRQIEHSGEVSGFVAENAVYPDDRAAIVVLTNLDATGAASQIAKQIAPLLFPSQDKNTQQRLDLAKQIFAGLQQGKIDRSLFTANANAYFSQQALQDFAASLGPLGAPTDFTQAAYRLRGGMGFRLYTVKFAEKTVNIWEREMPDGKIEQFQVMPGS